MAAICACRRNSSAIKNVIENIGIEIRAEPAERVELEAATGDVGIKSGEFEGTQIEIDSDAMPLVLQSGGENARGFVGGGFEFEMEANAVGAARKSGGVEKGISVRGIEIVLRDNGVEVWINGRQEAFGGTGGSMKKILDEGGAISGIRERLADFAAFEDGIIEIEADVGERCARGAGNFDARGTREGIDHIGCERIGFEVAGAFAEFEGASERVGNNAKADARERGRAGEVGGIAFENDFLIGNDARDAEWAGSDEVQREIGAGILRDDADGLANEIQRKRGVGRTQMEDNRPGVGRGDGINKGVSAALGGFDCACADGVESEFYVGGSEHLAVREMNAVAQMEDVGLRVGHFPLFGEVGREVEMIVALEQAIEEEEVEMGGEGVGADAGVEVSGHGFEEEVDG